VAQSASFRVFVDLLWLIRVGRKHDQTFLVENPDSLDALFVRNGLHDFVCSFTIVGKHGMPGSAGDTTGELIRTQDHGVEHLAFLVFRIDITGNPFNEGDNDGEGDNEL
jgi:hypothetical protein